MGKSRGAYGAFIIVLVSALLALAVFLINRLEFYERTVRQPLSRELRANNFYLLGQWLSGSGHPARFSPRWAGLKELNPREGGLLVLASLIDWEREGESLLPWVREGGVLLISIDPAWYWWASESASARLEALEAFLKTLGLKLLLPTGEGEDEYDEEYDEEYDDEGEEWKDFPDYDWSIGLEPLGEVPPEGEELILRDQGGRIRLVRRALGKGRLTVTGSCYFMYNRYLDLEANARLSWELTGASLDAGRPGMLFVRGRRATGGLFNTLRERGNLLPPLLSILVLVLVGFWTVIPGFGVRREEESAPRGAITGRFSSEARFIRRYGAYGPYLEAYLGELRRRSGGLGKDIEKLEAAYRADQGAGKRIGRRKMAEYLERLMAALERI
jgi:hypothetical protein